MIPVKKQISELPNSYKWELLLLLWLAFFLNKADRQIFSVVLPLIKADLGLSDGELGLISSALVWTYGVLVPFAGFIGDRISRKKIIGYSLLFWSIATVFTGVCSTLTQFLLLRGMATGGGEAFYAPAANALISEEHKKKRSFALSVHQTAVYIGIILSGFLAGFIAERYGWRNAFFLFGILGVILSIVVFFRFRNDQPAQGDERVSAIATARILVKKPTALLLTAAFACMVFVDVAYLTWMPSLLVEKFKLSITEAGFSSMFYHHIGAFVGVIVGGVFSDRLSISNSRNRLIIQSVGLLLGAPFIYWMALSDSTSSTYVALFGFGIFRGVYDANIFSSLYEVVKPNIRSSASGLMLMCAFLIGASSPVLLGVLKPTLGLSIGLSLLSSIYILGAFLIIVAALAFYHKDREFSNSINDES